MIKTLRASIVLVLLAIFLVGCASRLPVKRKEEEVTVGSLSFFFQSPAK
jgi:predicted component of type VI protein secretion system